MSSYLVVLSFNLLNNVCTSDSLETILFHLSTRVMDAIRNRNCAHNLYYLLEFLVAWKNRPGSLTRIAYEWCSAISEAAGRLEQREIPIIQPRLLGDDLQREIQREIQCKIQHQVHLPMITLECVRLGLKLRIRKQDPPLDLSWVIENGFSEVGPCCDLVRLDDASYQARRAPLEDPTPLDYAHLLSITLEIGFRLVEFSHSLNHTPHHDWVFETAFSSPDDEVVADAACVRAVCHNHGPSISCMRHLVKRVERDTPFSPRLRQVCIRAIENSSWSEPESEGSTLEVVRLLDRLDISVDDIVNESTWGWLLVVLMRSLAGPESLSSHYWRLLDKLAPFVLLTPDFGPWTMEVMGSLEESEDWEKLETWMEIVWRCRQTESTEDGSTEDKLMEDGSMEDIERMTLKLLSRRPSALPRFEDMCETGGLRDNGDELRRVCDQARTEQSSSESPPPYVSVCPPSISLF